MPDHRRRTSRTRRHGQLPGEWTSGAHALAALGPRTAEVVSRLLRKEREFNLFTKLEDSDHKHLASAFSQGWGDEAAARVIEKYSTRSHRHGEAVDAASLCRWIRQHPNEAEAVIDCMTVIPPDGVSVIRRLSQVGSQKEVYLASWILTQREIVLKRIIAPLDQQDMIFERESQPYPFSMAHPNIIETHPLTNSKGEKFLAEERLPIVLNDGWLSGGVQEAANLLYDVSKAMRYIHGELKLVHGDIKPDNIGNKDGAYILLDFGICRRIDQFKKDIPATGSLRTWAPELFETNRYDDPPKIDVWATAATVYKAVSGRFPFINPDERVPRLSTLDERNRFEDTIRARIRDEWDRWLDMKVVPEPLRPVLERALVRRPEDRATAAEMVTLCEKHLAGFLRSDRSNGGITALQELRQLLDYLPYNESLRLMPFAAKQLLSDRLKAFKQIDGLDRADVQAIENLLARLG